jgi:hypothetical protein
MVLHHFDKVRHAVGVVSTQHGRHRIGRVQVVAAVARTEGLPMITISLRESCSRWSRNIVRVGIMDLKSCVV